MELNLTQVRNNAKRVAKRDGYAQAIIREHDGGGYSFSRMYKGCCPEWYGKIIEVIQPPTFI